MPAYFTFLLKFRVWCSEKQNLSVPVIPWTLEREKKLRLANIWLKAFQFCIYAAYQREQNVIQDVCCSGCYGKRGVHSPLPSPHPTPKWQLGDHTNVNSKSPEDGTSSNDTTGGGRGGDYKHKYEWARNGRQRRFHSLTTPKAASLFSFLYLSSPNPRFASGPLSFSLIQLKLGHRVAPYIPAPRTGGHVLAHVESTLISSTNRSQPALCVCVWVCVRAHWVTEGHCSVN